MSGYLSRAVPELDAWSYDDAAPRDLVRWRQHVAVHANHTTRPIQPHDHDVYGWYTRVAVRVFEENGTFFVHAFRYELINANRQSVYRWSDSPD